MLFLNGKVKGTEILYMQDPDVFTSNSRQWIDYLLSKDSSTMGTGMTPSQPLRQGGGTGMRTFSMNPGSISKSAEFFDNTAKDFWNKIAEAPPEATDLHASPAFTLKGVLTKLGKKAYVDFMDTLDKNPALLAKVAQHFDLDTELFITEWPEEKVAAAPAAEFDPFGGDAEIVCIRSSDLMNERLSKTAALSALDIPSKERCMRDGILFIDKRAEGSKTLVAREEYRHRFSAPPRNGFYEILNRGGELEKVFVAQNPLIIENPAQSLPGSIVLDPESGVFVTPPMGRQVFVRSEFVTDEAIWKKKFKDMTPVSAAEVNKSYILVSPSMRASAPFRVNGKVKEGDEMHLVCDTPWEYKYRSSSVYDTCFPASCGSVGSHAGGMVKVVEHESESRVARVGNITFVPSSWRLHEVYGDSGSLEYANDYVPPQESPSEKKKREERNEKRKAYFKILPGDAGTLNAVTLNKDQFKLTLQKEASDRYQLGFGGVMIPVTRNEAMESMVMELDLPIEKAAELLGETVDHKGIKAFLVFKGAGVIDDFNNYRAVNSMTEMGGEAGRIAGGAAGFIAPAAIGSVVGGGLGGATSDDPETKARHRRIGALLGLIGGSLVGVPGAVGGSILGAGAGAATGKAVGEHLVKSGALPNSSAEDIVPMKGFGAGVQDVVGPYMQNRAGRVTAMAKATGRKEEEIPLITRYPTTMSILQALGGGLAGAAAGGGLGYLGGAMMGPGSRDVPYSVRTQNGAAVGALAGGAAGYLGAIINNVIKRRQFAREVAHGYDMISPEQRAALISEPEVNRAKDVLLPIGNIHRKGERDTYDHITGQSGVPEYGALTHSQLPTGIIGNMIAPGVGNVAQLGLQVASGLTTGGHVKDHRQEEISGGARERELQRLQSIGVLPKAASGPLSQWAAQKLARHGLNEDGAIYGGMAVPDLSTDLGPNISGVPEQTGAFANEVIPMNSMKDPADNWRDPDFANWDKMQQKDLDFLMRASDTGSKPVFESSMINLLLKTNRVSNQIEEWLPDLVNSLDSKCRLLLLFYWHSKDFSNDYGKDEMAEFEDVLLNAIKCDGQLVLFLKQSAGQSAHAMINPFQ